MQTMTQGNNGAGGEHQQYLTFRLGDETFAMPILMIAFAPGFIDEQERFGLAVVMTRITFPYLLFISLVSLMGGVLNGSGSLTVGGTLNWSGGTHSGTGATSISSGSTLTISGNATKTWDGRAITSSGSNLLNVK